MKKTTLFLLLFGAASVVMAQKPAGEEVISLSEPVEETEKYEVYGSAFDVTGEVLMLKEVLEKSDSFEGRQVAMKGTIKQVCQKKGCFFMLSDGNNQARITFKDYSFFIPTNSAGKQVTLKGTFHVEKLSEDKAKHYAEDAGENPDHIKGPQEEYSLIATTVKIMK